VQYLSIKGRSGETNDNELPQTSTGREEVRNERGIEKEKSYYSSYAFSATPNSSESTR
jgi:hypothetical protein